MKTATQSIKEQPTIQATQTGQNHQPTTATQTAKQ
jgi:hypothetical protein